MVRTPLWKRVIALIGFMAGVCVPIAGAMILLSMAFYAVTLGGCLSTPSLPFVGPPPPSLPSAPTILKVLVPDTSETFWYLGLLAALCFAAGVLAILGAIASRVIGFGLGGSSLVRAGLSCILLGIGTAALQRFLHAYLGIAVLITAIACLCASLPFFKMAFDWLKLKANIKKAQDLASQNPREAVAVLAGTDKRLDKVRKKILSHLESGMTVKGALKQAISK